LLGRAGSSSPRRGSTSFQQLLTLSLLLPHRLIPEWRRRNRTSARQPSAVSSSQPLQGASADEDGGEGDEQLGPYVLPPDTGKPLRGNKLWTQQFLLKTITTTAYDFLPRVLENKVGLAPQMQPCMRQAAHTPRAHGGCSRTAAEVLMLLGM
jgi:hypothetical protein